MKSETRKCRPVHLGRASANLRKTCFQARQSDSQSLLTEPSPQSGRAQPRTVTPLPGKLPMHCNCEYLAWDGCMPSFPTLSNHFGCDNKLNPKQKYEALRSLSFLDWKAFVELLELVQFLAISHLAPVASTWRLYEDYRSVTISGSAECWREMPWTTTSKQSLNNESHITVMDSALRRSKEEECTHLVAFDILSTVIDVC